MKEYFKNRKNQISAAVFLITMVIACAPLISRYCVNGHDLDYHLLRIESLKEGIMLGKPFLKINVLFFGGAGYASSMFYPDFLLYIPALLRVIGVSINASYHIFVAVCIILCYLSVYYCVKKMTGSTFGALIASVTLTLCQYHLDDIYVRAAVGEYTAFIFIPFVIYAIYNAVYEEMDKPQLFVLGYAGILLCHTSSFVMCTLFGLAALIICFKKVFLNKKVFLRLICSTIVTLLITCFYWLPMLEQFINTVFYVSTPWMEPVDEAVRFVNLFGPAFPGLGSVCILILIPRIFIRKKFPKTANNKTGDQAYSQIKINIVGYADLLILAGILFTLLACDLMPWERLGRFISFIQFPWRFFIMGSCLFSVAAGLIYARVAGRDDEEGRNRLLSIDPDDGISSVNLGAVVLIVILLLNGVSAFNAYKSGITGYYDYSDDYYSYKPVTANVIAGEWLPEAVKEMGSLVDDSEKMIADNGSEIPFTRVKNTIEADIGESVNSVDVPFIYYLGYGAGITDGSGKKTALTVTGEGHNGMCRVYLNGNTGRLKVSYNGTVLMHISEIISLVTAVCVIVLFIRKRRSAASGKEGHE
ncbi:MAG: hypothetical protein K6E63_11745 [Lachnospiraceae bacterium]|nr:hypothetical protein [Lachnospiraceae bacterium]